MPTFGYTAIGANQNTANSPRGSKFTAPGSGTITSIECYITNLGGIGTGVRAAVYSDASGSPDVKLAESSEITQTALNQDTWISFPLSLAITGGVVYWLMIFGEAGAAFVTYDTPGDVSDQFAYAGTTTYPNWVDPFNEDAFLDWKMAIYATYTAAGGGARFILGTH